MPRERRWERVNTLPSARISKWRARRTTSGPKTAAVGPKVRAIRHIPLVAPRRFLTMADVDLVGMFVMRVAPSSLSGRPLGSASEHLGGALEKLERN
jgi:hypothetical protein